MTRYVIIGAGAIGGALGGRLVQHGRSAVLVARGEHQRVMAERGLRLRTPDNDVVLEVDAPASPADVRLTTDDVLVLATKTHQAEAALIAWADQPVHDARSSEGVSSSLDGRFDAPDSVRGTAGELLPLLVALNGVAAEPIALRWFARVYGVCVWSPAVHLVPGEVIVRATPRSGVLHVGRYPAALRDDADDALLARVAADWTAATFKVALPDDVMPWKYNKLLQNLNNVFMALLGPGARGDLVDAVRDEGRQVLDAAGIPYTADEVERRHREDSFTVVDVAGTDRGLGGSTWQSLARGTGNLETDYLNGEIVRIAHGLGRPAPLNTALTRLARRAAVEGWPPGRLTLADLAAEMEAARSPEEAVGRIGR